MGFCGGFNNFGCNYGGYGGGHEKEDYGNSYNQGNEGILRFLDSLSPGTNVVLQYNSQCPACGTFQGFQDGDVLLTNFDGFPGLVRIAPNKVNAVSVFSDNKGCGRDHNHKKY